MVFVKHDGDLAITRAENNLDVQPNQGAKALFHIGDAAHGIDHLLLSDIHGVVHDLEQYLVLALKVMVEAALAELERGRYVVHGGGVIAALLKKAGSRAQDFLPRVNQGFTSHRVTW
jgi:hypothetical protein